MRQTLRADLASDRVVPGLFVMEFASNGIARIAAASGLRFVVLDMEHTGWTAETLARLIATTHLAGIAPLVRVPAVQPWFIAQALDAGASGIMAPMVASADEASALVELCRYPPLGSRGLALGYGHDDYRPREVTETLRQANGAVMVLAQIETEPGLRHVDAIASVEGIDVLWVGHYDLTASLGIPGRFDDPVYRSALKTVVEAAERHGRIGGINVASAPAAIDMAEVGFRLISFSDIRMLAAAIGSAVGSLLDGTIPRDAQRQDTSR